LQFPLLQAAQLQFFMQDLIRHGMNGGIEVAMLDFEFYNAPKDFFPVNDGHILALEKVDT
jgi:hypothetical protein